MAKRVLPTLSEEVKARFSSKFRKTGEDSCWPWLDGGSSQGYDVFTINRLDYKATHIALILDGRPRPTAPYDCALHSCHNPCCVNPRHLRWGSMAENNEDKLNAGRFEPNRGERNGRAILTEEDVRQIRSSTGSSRIVGARFGVSGKQVREIRRGAAWGHIT